MKRLVYAALSTLGLALSIAPSTFAGDYSYNPNINQSVSSTVHSSVWGSADMVNATHYIRVKVGGSALSRLTIDLPSGLAITKAIQVTNQEGQVVETAVENHHQQVALNFTRPVAPGTVLKVALPGITKSFVPDTVSYAISGRHIDTSLDLPIGLARVQTYDSIR